LKDIREKFKMTVIMASHNSMKMLEYADRVCVLKNGRITACDTAKKIFSNPELLNENGIQPPQEAMGNEQLAAGSEQGTKSREEVIEISDFCYSYEDDLCIKNINLSIAENDFAALIGRNGCGKTTLLKNITGLLRPVSGNIFVRGKDVKELSVSAISKEIGFVMQNPDNQLFTGTVFDEVAFALKNSGLPKNEINQRVKDALSAAGLEDINAFPHALSRAERTMTVVACVLAMGCKIIIFDEVDVGQDYRGSRKIMNIARELHSRGYTIIFVTHNMSLVREYAHRLIMMDRNGIIFDKFK
jgi:energy-coupling factor transporter ATP-binding protein EcfA2